MLRGRLRGALERVSVVDSLVVLGVLLVGINIGSAIWDAFSDRERFFREAQRDVSNMTSLLAEQTASGLEAADTVLRDLQRLGRAAQRAVPQLRDELAHVPHVAALLVFDEHGTIIARTNETPALDAS